MPATLLWFRRDLRLSDHPALMSAAGGGDHVLAAFVLDPFLLSRSGAPRVAFLLRTLRALDQDLMSSGGRLVVRSGRPETVVPQLVAECGAESVHVTRDCGPYGCARDATVEQALGQVDFVRTGSPYAVSPGRVRTRAGEPHRVYGAYYRAWMDHGWPAPASSDPRKVRWAELESERLPDEPELPTAMMLPPAGEAAALESLRSFGADRLLRYEQDRDRPDLDATSKLSAHLKFGTLHPRTVLAGLGNGDERFRRELAWREFYGAVLAAWPDSARLAFDQRLAGLEWSEGTLADGHFEAWSTGRTGYPMVDAGMRQLAKTGFMHNRLRMVTASFLVKDLHIDWVRGARHFMRMLIDGDLASNQHGWQWTAGTGTDAAPYHRVLNPVTQAKRFDPDGQYVRRWVPELAELDVPEIFEPWKARGGPPSGYPDPIVDHATERRAALELYASARERSKVRN